MIKRIFTSWNRGLFGKLLATYMLLIVLPVAFIGWVSFKASERPLNAQISQSHIKTLEQINNNIGVLIDQMTAVVNIYNLKTNLVPMLRKSYIGLSPNEEVMDRFAVENEMTNLSAPFDWLGFQSILIGQNGLVYTQNAVNASADTERLTRYPWIEELSKDPDRILWLGSNPSFLKGNEQRMVITAAKLLSADPSRRINGIFLLSVKEANLYNIYKSALGIGNEIYIVDRNMQVVSHSDRSMVGKIIDGTLDLEILDSGEDFRTTTLNNKKFLTLHKKISRMDWYIVENIPLANVYKEVQGIKWTILTTALLCVILSLAAAAIVSRRIAKPLVELGKRVLAYKMKGTPIDEGPAPKVSEMALLTTEYGNIVDKLERTISDLIRGEEEKRKAELRALQAQINPHFLYNTLNSVKCLVWVNKTELIEPTVQALVTLLEKTLQNDEPMITIQEELECIQHFLFIQEIRNEYKLSVHYHIEPGLVDCLIPKLLLQPIVENAVFHGIDPKNEGGSIDIYCTSYRGEIKIEIIDNGMGMDAETVKALSGESGKIRPYRFNGIGLKNVEERLRHHFGEIYRLHIQSEPGRGTSVTLTLPRLEKEFPGGETA
jgi:two-component system sensor histidine kinase YesM